jgi:hypothetical protein
MPPLKRTGGTTPTQLADNPAVRRIRKILDQLLTQQLEPSISIVSPENGSFLCVATASMPNVFRLEIAWSTLLVEGSLLVRLDQKDITSGFTVDDAALKATASIPWPSLGRHILEVNGRCLRNLIPLQFIELKASSKFEITPN